MLKCCFIFFSIFLCIVSIYISFNGVEYAHNRYQRAMMRLVRDIGRIRARKGQTGMNYALVPVLMGSDDGKDSLNIFKDLEKNEHIVTLEELVNADGRYNNDNEDDDIGEQVNKLWLCILGHVFDVSGGMKFYAPGKPYHILTGKDATVQLARGDLYSTTPTPTLYNVEEIEIQNNNDDKLQVMQKIHDNNNKKTKRTYDEFLNDEELNEARRWLEYFATHDKYFHVGHIGENIGLNIDDLVRKEIEQQQQQQQLFNDVNDIVDVDPSDDPSSASSLEPPAWHPKIPKGMKKSKQCTVLN